MEFLGIGYQELLLVLALLATLLGSRFNSAGKARQIGVLGWQLRRSGRIPKRHGLGA